MTRRRAILAIALLTLFAWCAGFFLAPLLALSGTDTSVIYDLYGRVCHQIDARSWHINGEPLGVCIRCAAIYCGALASLFVLLLVRTPHQRIARGAFVAAAFVVLVDVAMDVLGIVNNTELSRAITGSLVGLAAPWFVMPLLIEAVQQLVRKRALSQQGEVIHVRETE